MARKPKSSETLAVRIPHGLMAAARERCDKLGIPVSEFAREAMRRALGYEDAEPIDHATASTLQLERQCSRGDVLAYRELTRRYMTEAQGCEIEGDIDTACELYAFAMAFGCVALHFGYTHDDLIAIGIRYSRSRLARNFGRADRPDLADDIEVDVMAGLDRLADEGSAQAAIYLQQISPAISPALHRRAALMRAADLVNITSAHGGAF